VGELGLGGGMMGFVGDCWGMGSCSGMLLIGRIIKILWLYASNCWK
jgi:hypothetical protein